MAPLKRQRRDALPQEDDDDEVVDVQEARSSLQRSATRKRARLSLDDPKETPPRGRIDSTAALPSDSEDDNAPDSPPQTQYEVMRDDGFKHLLNTDYDDQMATQKLMQRPNTRLGNNMTAESGIIESIDCINFMCHTRLHVPLGPLINFIVGENGSGKSAVLTALTLCLGGKASDTNRGGSLRAFVKEGEERGKLVVRIKNAGSDAYQPHIYGDCIVVERHLSRTGASGFKILSASGRLISTKKQEVDEISEHYALQMGNPLTVLSQDNARQFLNSASPAQKYKYFVSGVQLEQLDNDYKLSQDTLDSTLVVRDDLTIRLEELKKQAETAQRLSDTAQKNHVLREKMRHYRSQLVWSQVVDAEKLVEARDADLVARDGRIAEAEAECDKMTQALQLADEKLERLNEARDAVTEEANASKALTEEADRNFQDRKNELMNLVREERDLHAMIKADKEEIAATIAKIKEEEERVGAATGSAREGKEAELSEAQRRQQDAETKQSDIRQLLSDLETECTEAQKEEVRIKSLRQAKKGEILAAQEHQKQLGKPARSIYDGYDNTMVALVESIGREKGFQTRPIGPLGAHIKLLKPEWSGIIEKMLGESLNAFIVTSKQDQARLSGIVRRVKMQRDPPVYITRGGSIDTQQHEPDARFNTILRVLEFEHDIIRSQLIINNQIEKIILVEKHAEALRLMVHGEPPRNVSACISFHEGEGKRGQGIRLTSRNGNHGTSIIMPEPNRRPRMRSESERQIAVAMEHSKQLGLEMIGIEKQIRQAAQATQEIKARTREAEEGRKTMERDVRQIRAEVERIRGELDAFEGADDRLEGLRTTLKDKKADGQRTGSQWAGMTLAKKEQNARNEDAKRKLEALREADRDFEHRQNKAAQKYQNHDSMRRIALSNKNAAFEKRDSERIERRRSEEKRNAKQKELESITSEAQGMIPDRVHIPEGETHASIEKKYCKLRDQMREREQRLGATDQECHDRAAEAKDRYEDVSRQTKDSDMTISILKQAIDQRLHVWRQFQRQISARIRIQFNYLLAERGFRGRIDLDHRARKVNIHIEPDETKKSAGGRNTKTLSGGEKSFSSICMLLSIWEAIGSPIRCLDEFDVFMDNVNRAVSTNLLIDAARRSVSRQYILITPNALEGRKHMDKDVNVHRLTDPRQQTLDQSLI